MTNPSSLVNRLTSLTREAVDNQARLAREYSELLQRALSGGADGVAAGRAYLDSVRRESERYWRVAASLGLDYAEDVVRLGDETTNAVARDVAQSLRSGSQPTESPTCATTAREVALQAPLGQSATATVTVANPHARDRRIAITPGPVLDGSGEVVDAELTVDPRIVTVPAGGEAEVTLRSTLTQDAFRAGEPYTARVEVTGGAQATVTAVITPGEVEKADG